MCGVTITEGLEFSAINTSNMDKNSRRREATSRNVPPSPTRSVKNTLLRRAEAAKRFATRNGIISLPEAAENTKNAFQPTPLPTHQQLSAALYFACKFYFLISKLAPHPSGLSNKFVILATAAVCDVGMCERARASEASFHPPSIPKTTKQTARAHAGFAESLVWCQFKPLLNSSLPDCLYAISTREDKLVAAAVLFAK
jgi:hypothetical protein